MAAHGLRRGFIALCKLIRKVAIVFMVIFSLLPGRAEASITASPLFDVDSVAVQLFFAADGDLARLVDQKKLERDILSWLSQSLAEHGKAEIPVLSGTNAEAGTVTLRLYLSLSANPRKAVPANYALLVAAIEARRFGGRGFDRAQIPAPDGMLVLRTDGGVEDGVRVLLRPWIEAIAETTKRPRHAHEPDMTTPDRSSKK
jgi:hypothetical protein